jgi:hypothetical protein
MAIFVWIVDKGGDLNSNPFDKQERFNLMEQYGIFFHLNELWNQIYEQTDMYISSSEDSFFEEASLEIFNDLLKKKIEESKDILVDEWTYCAEKNIVRSIDGNKYPPNQYDSVKAYVAESFVKFYKHEVIRAVQSDLILEVEKTFYTVKKKDLLEFLLSLKARVDITKAEDKRLYLSYS